MLCWEERKPGDGWCLVLGSRENPWDRAHLCFGLKPITGAPSSEVLPWFVPSSSDRAWLRGTFPRNLAGLGG